jgi:non-specific serine/threonine protein kinase
LGFFQGDFDRMGRLCEEGIEVARAADDKRHAAMGLFFLGVYRQFCHGDYEGGVALYEESIAVAHELGEKWLIGIARDALGFGALRHGDFDRAVALLEESLQLLREVGNSWLITFPLKNLGIHAFHHGDYERAQALCQECLSLHRQLADKWGVVVTLEILAGIAAAQGEAARAARLMGAAERHREALGAALSTDLQPDHDRAVAAARDTLGEAGFAAAWAEGRTLTLERAIGYALEELAVTAEPARAAGWTARAGA